MNLLFRFLRTLLVSRFRPRCDVFGPARTPFRVLPTDLDFLRHMNNGVYLSVLGIARIDLLIRSGLFGQLNERGWVPVVSEQSIRFRRALTLFQRFDVETEVVGWDEKRFYLRQRVLRGDDVVAVAFVAARFLASDRSLAPEEVLDLAGRDPGPGTPPAWAAELATAQQEMPANRA